MNSSGPSAWLRSAGTFNVAICLSDPSKYSETFVKRHVERLFGGRTVVVARMRKPGNTHHPTISLAPKSEISSDSAMAEETQRLVAFFRAHNVGFVLAEFGTVGLATYQFAKAAGLPMYCYFRGYDASLSLREEEYVSGIREMCGQIDGIVAVSRSLIDNLAAAGVVARKQFVIPSGVDTIAFTPAAKRPGSYLAVGRFIEKKAPQTLIRAFARALDHKPELSLDFVGDGPELEPCRALCAQLGVADRINLRGVLDHASVNDLMRTSAFFLQHSVVAQNGDSEGMPSAIQEAMACGCVVISTRHSGIPEHIRNNETGVMVDEHDWEQHAAEIVTLSAKPELCEAISKKARAYAVTHLDYRKLQAKLELLIQKERALHSMKARARSMTAALARAFGGRTDLGSREP